MISPSFKKSWDFRGNMVDILTYFSCVFETPFKSQSVMEYTSARKKRPTHKELPFVAKLLSRERCRVKNKAGHQLKL